MNEENLHKRTQELLDDTSFIRFVKGTNRDEDKDWTLWIKENPDERIYVDEAKSLLGLFQMEEDVDENRVSDLWNRIDKSTESDNIRDIGLPRKMIKRLVPLAIAACLGLFFISKMGSKITVNTQYAQIEKVTLPDNSLVTLNSDSKLSYSKKNFNNSRALDLEGEAFFNVEKGANFTVNTAYGDVKVLGTSFNVFARNGRFSVECRTGKVQVSKGSDEVIIEKGEEVNYNEGLSKLEKSNTIDARSQWQMGKFIYRNESLENVISDLEIQFDIDIESSDSIKELSYNGFFENKNMEEALKSVFWPMHLDYEVENKTVKITSKN